MRNHMDCIELSFPRLYRSRHLSRCRFIAGEQDRLDTGADAGEQRCEVIDAGVDTVFVRQRIAEREGQQALDSLDPGRLMNPTSVAEAYWALYIQRPDAWTFEQEIRPFGEKW